MSAEKDAPEVADIEVSTDGERQDATIRPPAASADGSGLAL